MKKRLRQLAVLGEPDHLLDAAVPSRLHPWIEPLGLSGAEHLEKVLHQLMQKVGLLRLLQETHAICTLVRLQLVFPPGQ